MADKSELLETVAGRIREVQEIHQSTRAAGYGHLTAALSADLQGDAARAETEIEQSDRFWPDLVTNWIWGELLLARDAAAALIRFKKVVDAMTTAIYFDSAHVSAASEIAGAHATSTPSRRAAKLRGTAFPPRRLRKDE